MRDQFQNFTTTAIDNYTETNDRVLDAIVDANRKVVDSAVKAADQLREQLDQIENLPEMPFADRLPTPAEAGARYIDFVERAADLNREFAHRVADALRVEETVASAPEAAEKPAAKKSTKKSTTKKSATKKSA